MNTKTMIEDLRAVARSTHNIDLSMPPAVARLLVAAVEWQELQIACNQSCPASCAAHYGCNGCPHDARQAIAAYRTAREEIEAK